MCNRQELIEKIKKDLEEFKNLEKWYCHLAEDDSQSERSYEYYSEMVRLLSGILEKLEAGVEFHICKNCKYYQDNYHEDGFVGNYCAAHNCMCFDTQYFLFCTEFERGE